MQPVIPYQIAISEEQIQRLRQKLLLTTLPEEVSLQQPRSRGAPLQEITSLVDYWLNTFDWRAQEEKLNAYPQFTTQVHVDGFGTYDVHFIHQRSQVKSAIPLLFLHGWPGSFIEATKILPELVKGGKDFPAFHIVAPSLVDYGFSQGNYKEGFNIDQHAETYHKLMQSLGYPEYVVQGGDIGHYIVRFLAMQYPTSCKAHHTNMPTPNQPDAVQHADLIARIEAEGGLSEKDVARMANTTKHVTQGLGYATMHSTRPQTIGYSLSDSPVGLLAWIYEKLLDWTVEYPWTADEILTWISIYWFSRAGPAAPQRVYYEMLHRKPKPVTDVVAEYIDVPLGISRFKRDILDLPTAWEPTLGPIVFRAEHEHGGHFAAWECPHLLVGDLRKMFDRSSPVFGCVPGHNGFA